MILWIPKLAIMQIPQVGIMLHTLNNISCKKHLQKMAVVRVWVQYIHKDVRYIYVCN